ncbi:apurinic/apyrimidinic endonuclease family protein [Gorillibacterium timonense]|uniref:TIM barrel protein n=1 Tax=Gorillibacterium timonense TaxID=1689269 RepID=UPI00071DDD02|nr:TIM barrel protein [Gorillibacterium timonense]
MRRFLIGQHGRFNEEKDRRDYRAWFYGVEACLLREEEDVRKLAQAAEERGFRIGVHFPLRGEPGMLRDALFLSPDARVRCEAWKYIDCEIAGMRSLRPEYVLFHYPKPVLVAEEVDAEKWRFADNREFLSQTSISPEEFRSLSDELFARLTERSTREGWIPVLEFDLIPRVIYETDLLEELLDKHRRIRLCLDTARLYLQERTDPGFTAADLIQKFARYAHLIHLSNLHDGDPPIRHVPVMPDQQTEEGWAPIAEYLTLIRKENPEVRVLFEHRSEEISDEELDNCYAWAEELLNG